MEDEDFLAAVEADNANAPVEEPKEPEPAKAEEPKEAPKEPDQPAEAPKEPETPVEPPVTAEVQPKAEPIMVPLAALHETRDEVKSLKDQLSRFQQTQQANQPAPQAPDPYEDPEGFAAFQSSQIQTVLLNHTLDTSERFARKEHGAETVEAAKQWALQRYATDPLYREQVLRDPDPYERVVKDFRREELFSKVSDPSEFDAFLQWKAAQSQLSGAPASSPNPTPTAIPPRSLAGAPSAGGIDSPVIQSDEEMFAEVIPKG